MSLIIRPTEKLHLKPLMHFNPEDVTTICKAAFNYLINGPESNDIKIICKSIVDKYNNKQLQIEEADIQCILEALISLLVEATKSNSKFESIQTVLLQNDFNADATEILSQFLCSKRSFIAQCIKTEDIEYHLIDLDWRFEVRLASRALLKQSTICVTMKLNLHTEPRSQYRQLLDEDASSSSDHLSKWDKGKRKDILVQIDVNSLKHMIHVLEQALLQSRTRRVRNLVSALH